VRPQPSSSNLATLTLGAVGVVYGDIGTSPLYAFKEVFAPGHVPLTTDNILGVLSLMFWTLTVIVSIKYVVLILRADNHGEGGLIAMLALASQAVKHRPELRRRLLILGIFGTAIFFGDGVITPAVSVLGAVEGLEVAAPGLHRYVVPVSLGVLTLLFVVQRHGTGGIGRLFGPVTVLWFIVIAVLGAMHIMRNPAVMWALSPHHVVRHRGRSAVCRHGPLRQAADPHCLVRARHARARAQLLRPGGDAAGQPGEGQQPVL
jgi:KUP system potassium uptake protein